MRSAWESLPAADEEGNVLAVIESPAGSRCKFKFEPSYGVFLLHGILPIGTAFPHAFGFVPSTLAEDGDPLDILVLVDEAAPVTTVVPCRIVAVLEAQQKNHGKMIRNDRLLGIAVASERYAQCRKRKDIEQTVLDRIADFFAFYHREQGKHFQPKRWKGRKTALKLLESGQRAFLKHRSSERKSPQ